jgi:transcriptional regulator with XRE-family HTH domain
MNASSKNSPTPEEAAISRLLRAYREHRGLTAVALAESIGVTSATYRRIEQGQRSASLTQLQQICRVLSIELDDLADGAKRLATQSQGTRLGVQGRACRKDAACKKRGQ